MLASLLSIVLVLSCVIIPQTIIPVDAATGSEYVSTLNSIASSMDLGITTGEVIAGYDFNELSSVPSNFIGQAQGIQSITVNSETKNAFNVKSDTSATTVMHPVGTSNFA
ncbi:MAG: hypothetical protein J6Q56_02270, partial [Clostridia bacterium]|nr:hypothetical protein [Clostridia bacterium]